MENNKTPDCLYHYTSINTLGFILKNHNIRFNNLTDMDDLDEGTFIGGKWGKFCFASSWTADVDETIPMWSMYSDKMNGIRLCLPRCPFVDYPYYTKDGKTVDVVRSLVSAEQMVADGYGVIAPHTLTQVLYNDIEHIDFLRNENIIEYSTNGSKIHVNKLGINKSSYWSFQSEYRYLVYMFPQSLLVTPEEAQWIHAIVDFPRYLEFDISDCAYESMEIVIGPKCNEVDAEIVHMLVEKYNPKAKVRLSALHGRIG